MRRTGRFPHRSCGRASARSGARTTGSFVSDQTSCRSVWNNVASIGVGRLKCDFRTGPVGAAAGPREPCADAALCGREDLHDVEPLGRALPRAARADRRLWRELRGSARRVPLRGARDPAPGRVANEQACPTRRTRSRRRSCGTRATSTAGTSDTPRSTSGRRAGAPAGQPSTTNSGGKSPAASPAAPPSSRL